jgi:hypothetical protein
MPVTGVETRRLRQTGDFVPRDDANNPAIACQFWATD